MGDTSAPAGRLAGASVVVAELRPESRYNLDAVEPKLFGLGAESYTVGSHEFYMGYADYDVALTVPAEFGGLGSDWAG